MKATPTRAPTRNARLVGAAAVLSVGLGMVTAVPAPAGDDEVIRRGNCSGSEGGDTPSSSSWRRGSSRSSRSSSPPAG